MSVKGPERAESSEAVARRVAEIADDKGATDVVALDVRPLVGYTDFLVICSARNERQAKAINDEVLDRMREEGRKPARVEGEREAEWVLLDYLDCVLHIFTPDAARAVPARPVVGRGRAARAGTGRRGRVGPLRPAPRLAFRSWRGNDFAGCSSAATTLLRCGRRSTSATSA